MFCSLLHASKITSFWDIMLLEVQYIAVYLSFRLQVRSASHAVTGMCTFQAGDAWNLGQGVKRKKNSSDQNKYLYANGNFSVIYLRLLNIKIYLIKVTANKQYWQKKVTDVQNLENIYFFLSAHVALKLSMAKPVGEWSWITSTVVHCLS